MRNTIIKLFLLLIPFFCQAQNQIEKDKLSKTIYQILEGFKDKDAAKINTFISKKLGVGIIFLSEDFTKAGYLNMEEIDFNYYFPLHNSFWDISKPPKIKFETSPVFSLHDQDWSKYGLFCEQRSEIVTQYINWFSEQGSDLSEEELFRINLNFNNVAHVTFADSESNGLEFILTKIDSKWTLTFINITSVQPFD